MTSTLLKQVERFRYLAILLLSVCGYATADAQETAATSDEINAAIMADSAILPTWTNDADYPWYLYETYIYDDNDNHITSYRLRTPNVPSGSTSTLSMTYSSEFETALYFESEVSGYEESQLSMLVDGEEAELITGSNRHRSFIRIPSGSHTVTFIGGYRVSYLYSMWIGEVGDLAAQCVKDGSVPLTFTNDATYPWVTREGFINSTNFTEPGSTSKVSTSITITEPSRFSYECRTVSYTCTTNVYVDGKLYDVINKISTSDNPWQKRTAMLDAGTHTIEFENVITDTPTPSSMTQIRNVSVDSDFTEVAVTTPGQFVTLLVDKIGDKSVMDVETLKISGTLNDKDWEGIKQLKGVMTIDLSDAAITEVPSGAFQGLSKLTHVILPETLVKIGSRAFYESPLTSIHIPASVEVIGGSAFYYSYLSSITFGENSKLKEIGPDAFMSTKITEFIMPDSVESAGSGMFQRCQNLTKLHISSSLEIIPGEFTGYYNTGCPKLKIIELPENLKEIGYYALANTAIESIVIPKNVTTIGHAAFYGNSQLKEVTLNSYANNLYSTFDRCGAIQTIIVPSVTPPTIAEGGSADPFSAIDKDAVEVIVPEFALGTYKVDSYWFQFRNLRSTSDVSTSDFWAIHGHLKLNSSYTFSGTPSIEIEAGGILDVAANTPLALDAVTYNNQEDVPAVFLNESDQVTANSLVTKFTVPSSGRWYFFSPVTDVNMADVTYPATDSWVIRYYDGAQRASTNSVTGNWVNMPANGTLKRGQGYIIQAATAGTLYMPANSTQQSAFFGIDEAAMSLDDNTCDDPVNAGWNLVGNPYPAFYDIYSMALEAPITVYNGSSYRAYSLSDDDFVLRPMQPFFVQKETAELTLGMPRSGRLGTSAITRTSAPRAIAKDANRQLLNLEIVSGDNETVDDYTRIVLNEAASLSYEGKCDASKFMSMDTEVAQIYSLGQNRTALAINERPYADGNAALGVYIPKAGVAYRIAASRADRKAWLYDAVNGTEQDLTEADYIFTADKAGNDDARFSIRFAPAEGNAVEGVEAAEVKVAGGKGMLTVSAPADAEVAVYAADGSLVANGQGAMEVSVAAGVYVVKVNGQGYKTIVK